MLLTPGEHKSCLPLGEMGQQRLHAASGSGRLSVLIPRANGPVAPASTWGHTARDGSQSPQRGKV